nr:ATPase subunit 8 [Actinocyclus sp. mgcode 4]
MTNKIFLIYILLNIVYRFIPQFDIITLGVQIFNLVLLFYTFYYINIRFLIPFCVEIKKFRIKKYKKSYSNICKHYISFCIKHSLVINNIKTFI